MQTFALARWVGIRAFGVVRRFGAQVAMQGETLLVRDAACADAACADAACAGCRLCGCCWCGMPLVRMLLVRDLAVVKDRSRVAGWSLRVAGWSLWVAGWSLRFAVALDEQAGSVF